MDTTPTTVRIPKNLAHLARIVAVTRGVPLYEYVESILRPAICVDHTNLSHGGLKLEEGVLQLLATAKGVTEEEYKAAALERQMSLDFVTEVDRVAEALKAEPATA